MDELKTLIFRTDRIGDFIISCPFALSYKKNFNNRKLIVISSEYNYQYIKNFKFIHEVHPLKNKIKFFPKLYILVKMILFLRKTKYEDIIVLDGKKRSFFISLFLNGKKSILLQSRNLEFLSKVFKYISVFNYELQDQLKNFSFLAGLLNFNINFRELNIYEDYRFKNNFLIKKNYIIIHLDEKWYNSLYYKDFTDINPTKDQLNLFVNKIFEILNYKYDIVLTSGNKKLKIIEEFTNDFEKITENKFVKKNKYNSILYFNKTSFNDLESIIKNSSFLICCEGGVSHVSHNFGIKTIAFYEENRFQHTNYWTGHMKNLSLYKRNRMEYVLQDKSFFNLIQKKINHFN